MDGVKYDSDKPRPELMHPEFLMAVSRVLACGAKKYSDDNWKRVDNLRGRYTGAALRHMFQYMQGETKDEETGESHLAHAACCLMFLYYEEQREDVWETFHKLSES